MNDFPTFEDLGRGLNSVKKTQRYIHIHYPEFEEYILNNFSFVTTWSEKIYCYFNDIKSIPVCTECSKPVKFRGVSYGYSKFCSHKCANSSQSKKNQAITTCLTRYGVENPFQSCEIKNKIKLTCLDKYGVENPMQSEMIKDKMSNIISSDEVQVKTKLTCRERYNADNPSLSNIIKDKIKQTCLARYGAGSYTQSVEGRNKLSNILGSQEIQDKINETKRLNHTFSTSKIEDMFDAYLNERGIQHVRQYKSTLYPFCCDFYLPAYDLYIEIQANWAHGGHPYGAEHDAEKIGCWRSKHTRYYDAAIEIWTQRDVKKRETAKLNNLNYLEIFSNDINECIKQFEDYINKTQL